MGVEVNAPCPRFLVVSLLGMTDHLTSMPQCHSERREESRVGVEVNAPCPRFLVVSLLGMTDHLTSTPPFIG